MRQARPPYFETEVDAGYIPVMLRPEDLESAGWVYVGDEPESGVEYTTRDGVVDQVRLWHDSNHSLPWMHCTHELCDRILRG